METFTFTHRYSIPKSEYRKLSLTPELIQQQTCWIIENMSNIAKGSAETKLLSSQEKTTNMGDQVVEVELQTRFNNTDEGNTYMTYLQIRETFKCSDIGRS